jgi:recombination protein RecA
MFEERLKVLKQAMSGIEKQFGKGAIMLLGDGVTDDDPIEAIPTGSIGLDLALGIGGIPRGRVVEIYGPESSGKTTLTLHCIAEAQKQGLVCAFVDAEHALDVTYAKKLGIKVEELLVSQPDSGEQALEICETLVRSAAVDLIVVDSVAALVPKAELEGDMGDSHMGLQARLMSQALRKLTGAVSRTNTTLLFINQLRQKIGVMFGNPETTTGGNALKYYASVRLDIRRAGVIKDGDNVRGHKARIKVVKNKLAPPFREVEVDIVFGLGIDALSDLLDRAIASGHIDRSGNWYTMGGEKFGPGREKAREALSTRPELVQQLREWVLASAFASGSPGKPPTETEDQDKTH